MSVDDHSPREVSRRGGSRIADRTSRNPLRSPAKKDDLASALREGPETIEGCFGEQFRPRQNHRAIAIPAKRLEGAMPGFEIVRQRIFADDIEIDLMLAQQPLR